MMSAEVKKIVLKGRCLRWASTETTSDECLLNGVEFQDSDGVLVSFLALGVDLRLMSTLKEAGEYEFFILRVRSDKGLLGYLYAIRTPTAHVYYPGPVHENAFRHLGLVGSGFHGKIWAGVNGNAGAIAMLYFLELIGFGLIAAIFGKAGGYLMPLVFCAPAYLIFYPRFFGWKKVSGFEDNDRELQEGGFTVG